MSTVETVRPLAHQIPDACRLVGCGRTKMYSLIGEGAITARKIGTRTVVLDDSLRAFMAGAPTLGAR